MTNPVLAPVLFKFEFASSLCVTALRTVCVRPAAYFYTSLIPSDCLPLWGVMFSRMSFCLSTLNVFLPAQLSNLEKRQLLYKIKAKMSPLKNMYKDNVYNKFSASARQRYNVYLNTILYFYTVIFQREKLLLTTAIYFCFLFIWQLQSRLTFQIKICH